MVVPRLTSAINWAIWLNTVTGDIFWMACGCIGLFLVIFFYLKQRYSMHYAVIGSSTSVAFVSLFFYSAGLVSQTFLITVIAVSVISLVIPGD